MATTSTSISVATNADLDSFTRSDDKYVVMGVARTATAADIKQAFRRLALLYHPDRHTGKAQQRAEEIFKRISAANETLSDPELRAQYDRLLARGEAGDLAAEARRQQIDPLDQILSGILRYRHIFDARLPNTPGDLREAVYQNLMTGDVRKDKRGQRKAAEEDGRFEEIVGDMPLREAPSGITYQGAFKKGSVIITNLRVFVAFESQQVETSGNVQTTYTFRYLRAALFPAMEYVSIDRTERLRNRFTVFIAADQSFGFVPKVSQLGKLLLLCSIWGVVVRPEESYSRANEQAHVLLRRPAKAVMVVGIFFGLAFLCVACDAGPSAAPVMFLFFLPWAITLGGLVQAWGLVQFYRAYGRRGIVDVLHEADADA